VHPALLAEPLIGSDHAQKDSVASRFAILGLQTYASNQDGELRREAVVDQHCRWMPDDGTLFENTSQFTSAWDCSSEEDR
jgi:hypothetical protein